MKFAKTHKHGVDIKLTKKHTRQEEFTQSVEVGFEAFFDGVQKELGSRAKGGNIILSPYGAYQLVKAIA